MVTSLAIRNNDKQIHSLQDIYAINGQISKELNYFYSIIVTTAWLINSLKCDLLGC